MNTTVWLAGAHYTIADIANYGWLHYAEGVGIELQEYPKLRAWREAIDSRLSVAKALRRVDNPDSHFADSMAAALLV